MMEMQSLLESLISAPGLSGHETPIRLLIEDAWRPLTDEISLSRLGSLHALKRGFSPPPRRSLLLAAHMDAIGLMVTALDDGFLRLTKVGGLDARVLPGQLVTVHGREDLTGIVVQPPAHLLPEDNRSGPVRLENLLVDVGLLSKDVSKMVRPGDLVSFAQPVIKIDSDTLAGHSLDNRASVVAVTQCLEDLKAREHAWDVWAVATTQEEETMGGAFTSSYQLQPDLAVVVDVTHASSPGSPSHKSFPMGKGPTLIYGPNIHPALHANFKELADRLEIPYKVEVTSAHSGTDAFAVQVTAQGIPCMVLGIPLRYMHTPVEMVSLKDIQRTGRLLAEFVASLDDTFIEKINWDER